MKLALIGLGSMGVGIAHNLLKSGHELTVYNRTRSRAEALRPKATVADTPGRAASNAEAVITMVADDRALEDVVFATGTVLDSLAPSAIHISMSTISVAMAERLTAAHAERNQHFVSAPVFGRPDAAEGAKLSVVAAGAADQIERCRPIFAAVGQKTFVSGDKPSQANVVKICGNFLITAMIEGLAESFALVRKSGMDVTQFLEIMTGTLFGAPVYKTYGTLLAAGDSRRPGSN